MCLSVVFTAGFKAMFRSGLARPVAFTATAAVSMGFRQKAIALAALVGAVVSVVNACTKPEFDEEGEGEGKEGELEPTS